MIRFLSVSLVCFVASVFAVVFAEEGNTTVKLPFGSDPNVTSVSFESVPQPLNFAGVHEICVTVSIDRPEAVGAVPLAIHNVNGWHQVHFHRGIVQKPGRQQLIYPSPWDFSQVDQIRLTFYRNEGVDATVKVLGWELRAITERHFSELPPQPDEFRFAYARVGNMEWVGGIPISGLVPGDWDRTMAELKKTGFHAVVPLLRYGEAHYDSKFWPHSEVFEKHGDQLQQAVQAGKKHGIEVHVWVANFYLHRVPKELTDAMQQAGRMQVYFDGTVDKHLLCPTHPENRKLECDSMVEIVKNYDVAGVSFDYVRFGGDEYTGGPSLCYCDGCRERFEKSVGEKITDWPRATRSAQWSKKFNDWRREQITALVVDVQREAKKVKPSAKISAAVFPVESKNLVLQDWPLWVEKGYLDFVTVMIYDRSDQQFDMMVEHAMEVMKNSGGKTPVYPIMASTRYDNLTLDQMRTQMMIVRGHGAPGFGVFHVDEEAIKTTLPFLNFGSPRENVPAP